MKGLALILGAMLCVASCGSQPVAPMPEPEPGPSPACPAAGPGLELGGTGLGAADARRTPYRTLVLMGGARESDAASTLFLEGAAGGDVVVLRASGSVTSYPEYFLEQLNAVPKPRTAIAARFSGSAAAQVAVLCRVGRAEAIWLAGGNQADYLAGWHRTLHDSLVTATGREVAMGGTSAGAMSLGQVAFDAGFGTVTSTEALSNPFRSEVSLRLSPFPQPELQGFIVDTHFMDRDREGRLLTFVARATRLTGREDMAAIGLDETASMVIRDGAFEVFAARGAAWLYLNDGDVRLSEGSPLEMDRVLRWQLPSGSTGAWPPQWDPSMADTLRVVAGEIR